MQAGAVAEVADERVEQGGRLNDAGEGAGLGQAEREVLLQAGQERRDIGGVDIMREVRADDGGDIPQLEAVRGCFLRLGLGFVVRGGPLGNGQ